MSWFVLILLASFFFAVALVIQRSLLKAQASDPIAYAISFQFIAAFVVFAYTVFAGFTFSGMNTVLPNIVLSATLYTGMHFAFFYAMKLAEASEVSVISASRSFWTLVGSVLFLGEAINSSVVAGTFLVIGGVAVVFYRKGKWRFNKGHLFAFLFSFIFAFALINDSFIVKRVDIPSYFVISFLGPPLIMSFLRPKSVRLVGYFLKEGRLAKLLLFSVLYAASALLAFFAIKIGGPASKVFPIGQSSIIMTVVLAAIFLNERSYLLNKFVGAILVFLGVLLLR